MDNRNTGVDILTLKLLVVTLALKAPFSAELQRIELMQNEWHPIGAPVNVVIGRNGLIDAAHKIEGDGKTPMGLFKLGPDFGFAKSTLVISKNTVCVDDVHSKYYGKIIDTNAIPQIDWHSAEQMYTQPLYRQGVAVQTEGVGSCIFLHVWRGPDHGTAGCIAMSKANMKMLKAWLGGSVAYLQISSNKLN